MLVSAGASVAAAQDQNQERKTTHQKVRTVTGCLEKAGDSNEHKLTTADGSTWEVKPPLHAFLRSDSRIEFSSDRATHGAPRNLAA
jgi:hypothetical protein